jgi:cysteine desulfurase / selenocysteine lyase
MSPFNPTQPSGIVAFRHPRSAEIHARLEQANIHVMHSAGRIRVAIHGYNTAQDIDHLMTELAKFA